MVIPPQGARRTTVAVQAEADLRGVAEDSVRPGAADILRRSITIRARSTRVHRIGTRAPEATLMTTENPIVR